MTISLANVAVATDTFDQWIVKTNFLLDAMSNKVVTTDSNTAVGNAAVTNSFTANTLFANTISGGNTTTPAAVSFSTNTTFASNATFTGTRTNLGLAANVAIQGGNSTFRVVTVSSAASNTLVVTKINTGDLSDISVSSPATGDILKYSTAASAWVNTPRYTEVVTNASPTSTQTIDWATRNVFNLTLQGNTVITFTNPPPAGTMQAMTVILTQDATGSRLVTWPSAVKWSYSSAPVLTTTPNYRDVFTFITFDGGTTYAGSFSLANVAIS